MVIYSSSRRSVVVEGDDAPLSACTSMETRAGSSPSTVVMPLRARPRSGSDVQVRIRRAWLPARRSWSRATIRRPGSTPSVGAAMRPPCDGSEPSSERCIRLPVLRAREQAAASHNVPDEVGASLAHNAGSRHRSCRRPTEHEFVDLCPNELEAHPSDLRPAIANIEDLGVQRGHRTLHIVGKGNKPATVPLVPRTARTIDLAIGERCEGPILRRRDGQRLDRRTAHRWIRAIRKRAGLGSVHPHMLRAGFIMAALDAGVPLRDVQTLPASPTPEQPPSTTADARTSTVTPPTSSSPRSLEAEASRRPAH